MGKLLIEVGSHRRSEMPACRNKEIRKNKLTFFSESRGQVTGVWEPKERCNLGNEVTEEGSWVIRQGLRTAFIFYFKYGKPWMSIDLWGIRRSKTASNLRILRTFSVFIKTNRRYREESLMQAYFI